MSFPANKRITGSFDYHFHIPENGVYTISIAARCRSGEQIRKRGGEDLRIEIDGIAPREIPAASKPQYQDIPASWNGTLLRGAKQTVIFIMRLQAGEHTIAFIPQEGAAIEREPTLSPISNLAAINLDPEEHAEDGDRRPWFTFAFIDLPLDSFSIDASVRWHWRDGDDIKLVIDGEVQKNTSPLSVFHRKWLWSSFPFQSNRQEKTFSPVLPKGIHYIELWADRTPILHRARFDASGSGDASVKAKVIWQSTVLRTDHNTVSDIMVEDIPHGEWVVILERATRGERIKNSKGDFLSTNRWHKVKYGGDVGYIYSLALEMEGESQIAIQQIMAHEAEAVGMNPEILLALADCESNAFPYTVSWNRDNPKVEVAFGVMQLSKKLIEDLNNPSKPFYSPVDSDDVFNLHHNIRGGIRYFQHLYDTVYKNSKDRLRKSIAAYNAGTGNVPIDQAFNLGIYEGQTKRDVLCVERHLRRKTFQKILSRAKTASFLIFGLAAALWLNETMVAPALGMLIDNRSAAIMKAVDHAHGIPQDLWRIPHAFPAVSLNKGDTELIFFNRNGERTAHVPVGRLGSLGGMPITASLGNIWLNRGILEYHDGTFYFSATASALCHVTRESHGESNCAATVYRFDANTNDLRIVLRSLEGSNNGLYLSPDASRLAIARSVMTSICSAEDYLTILNLADGTTKEYDVVGKRDHDLNAITFVTWRDERHAVIAIEHSDQPNCTVPEPGPPRKETKAITLTAQ
ncbi:MAG: lytic transglycosylase domain-containing protein [Candidatus Sungiibacteriota bacterium]